MTWLLAMCALGLAAGFLLMFRVPLCPPATYRADSQFSIIIPARNEEENIAVLLESIARGSLQPSEVIVVDDDSTDRTSEVAQRWGARVIPSEDLPRDWTGKTWACHQGALAARSNAFIFLDADTRLEMDGLERIVAFSLEQGAENAAFSVLPYHLTQKPYEEFSLFFHLLMAMGTSGFGALSKPCLFGQSLLISRKLYHRGGGHRVVREQILENFMLSSHIYAAGARCVTRGGRGALNIRMFPHGFAELCESWSKGFADGAAATDPVVLAVSICWLAAALLSFLLLLLSITSAYAYPVALYLCFVLQLIYFSRQIGSYRFVTCLLYPVPLIFYFAIFTQSVYSRLIKRTVVWRGREI
jgi:4,4'-diaponeurosporenoate glycosyltransferase